MIDLQAVDAGFSRKAEIYDAYCEGHPVIRWQRSLIRQDVLNFLPAGGHILELNAGTGSDALYFVKQGYHVHATDISGGMIAAIQNKINKSGAGNRFTVQQLSFTNLGRVLGSPYDMVFSNFGGLNCMPDMKEVADSLPALLKPGGYVVLVIMPPVCPWELSLILRGQFRVALRRLHPNGIMANVEGAQVMTWYHSPHTVAKAFAPKFRLVYQQALSLFCLPSYMDRFPHRFPKLTELLCRLDTSLGRYYPFRNWGDFLVYTLHYGV